MPIKTAEKYALEIEKVILKFICNCKVTKVKKTVLKKEKLDSLYYMVSRQIINLQ